MLAYKPLQVLRLGCNRHDSRYNRCGEHCDGQGTAPSIFPSSEFPIPSTVSMTAMSPLKSPLRHSLALTTLVGLTILVAPGCERQSPKGGTDGEINQSTTPAESNAAVPEADFFELAKQCYRTGDYDRAADTAYKVLIQEPNNVAASLLVAQVEAARGNLETAIELASAIDIQSPLGREAIQLQMEVLLKLDRTSDAADVIVSALQKGVDVTQWRHDAWRLLNQSGRREEASAQALKLCESGLATERELLSLISQSLSFPTPGMLKDDKNAVRLFSKGLGKARWFFSSGEHPRALEELADQAKDGFENAATEAFYGRVLAESQRWDEFRSWSHNASEEAKRFKDYWAAIGNFFIDNRRNEAAARALLEAISRDPTDRVSMQRLSKVFFALGRTEDGEQFRFRGVEISKSEREAQTLYASPQDRDARTRMARDLMELGRPFETLAWTVTLLPPNADGPRRTIAAQRAELLNNPDAMKMAVESSLLGVDPAEFKLEPAWTELLTDNSIVKPKAVAPKREIAATPRLVNRAKEMGLDFQWYKDVEIQFDSIPIHESLGGGIAVLDYDLDGWPDVYLAQGSGDPPTDACTRSSQMFRNLSKRFVDTTPLAQGEDFNYSSGIAAGDVNQDGFPDLYMGSLGHNRLLVNNGDGTFHDATSLIDQGPDRFSTSLGIADINGDHVPDLFESNYIEMNGGFDVPKVGPDGRLEPPTPLSHYADSDRWFENLGDGQYRIHEIGRTVAKPGTSLGLIITDFESDGKNEVFVGNDGRPNHYLVQSGKNEFVNLAESNGLANGFDGVANGCMGIATGDFNRDGRLDLQIANYSLEPANLYIQSTEKDFTDQAASYGLAALTYPFVGFGTKAVDLDHNGFLDFIVANGHIFDLRYAGEPFWMPPQLLMSDGRSYQSVTVEDDSGYWKDTYLGRTVSLIDYDRDGATDFLVGHLDKPLALLHNETKSIGNEVQLELIGTTSERDAIGAKLVLTIGNSQYTEWVTAGDGYLSTDEPVTQFAFPNQEETCQIAIDWPSGTHQLFEKVKVGHRYLAVEGLPELEQRN